VKALRSGAIRKVTRVAVLIISDEIVDYELQRRVDGFNCYGDPC